MISDPLGDAARWVRDGGLLAYPTETVWGLGADAGSEEAVKRLRHWKGRDVDLFDWGGGGAYKEKYGCVKIRIPWFRKSRLGFQLRAI